MRFISSHFQGLWRHSDFLKLWAGETVSLFGSQITTLALPLLAALTLNSTPEQMGILLALQFAPYLLITLFVGVWIDRSRRRPILIAANLSRAFLMGFIPLFFLLGMLKISLLYPIVFATSLLTVIFDLAYQSYLPSLVQRDHLVEGNSKLQMSSAFAQVTGPNLGGVLVDLLSAPIVILMDSASYLISAITVLSISHREPRPQLEPLDKKTFWLEIQNGIQFVFKSSILRPIAFEAATYNLFSLITSSALILYLTRVLNFHPSLIGLIFGTASVGSLVGSAAAGPLGRRFGIGPTIVGSMLIACASPLLVPFAGGSFAFEISILLLSFFLGGFGLVVSVVHVISLRQAVIPNHMLGRVNACYRFICSGLTPVGAYLGGKFGELFGLRETLLIGAFGTLLAVLWVWFSEVRKLKQLPASPFESFHSIEKAVSSDSVSASPIEEPEAVLPVG